MCCCNFAEKVVCGKKTRYLSGSGRLVKSINENRLKYLKCLIECSYLEGRSQVPPIRLEPVGAVLVVGVAAGWWPEEGVASRPSPNPRPSSSWGAWPWGEGVLLPRNPGPRSDPLEPFAQPQWASKTSRLRLGQPMGRVTRHPGLGPLHLLRTGRNHQWKRRHQASATQTIPVIKQSMNDYVF